MFYNSKEIEEKITYISKGATLFDMLTVGVVLIKTTLISLSKEKKLADTIKEHIINFLNSDLNNFTNMNSYNKPEGNLVEVNCSLCGNKFKVPEKDKDIGAQICPNHSFKDFSQYNN